ncbi:MAG: M20/M25/M40 family metallo-hydrolase [Parvularculaceae bacterium]
MKTTVLWALAAWCVGMGAAQAQLTAEEQRIRDIVAAQQSDAIEFLGEVVDINSGTMNHDGVRAVGARFRDELSQLGFETQWEDFAPEIDRAGHLVATHAGETGRKLLLIGHLDTVFDDAAGGQKFSVDGDIANGAGVADMKGGDVVLLYALKALAEAGALDDAQIDVVLTGDEELTGKPVSVSRASLTAAAKRADVALNFEGGEPGAAVTSRRGASGWTLTTTGLRRHSSGIFSDETGAGAIFEAARILNEFYEELSNEKYLTFNPGVILGGTDVAYDPARNEGEALGKTNVVAQKVVVDGGLRFISEEQKTRARARMRKIVEKHRPQTGAEIEFVDSYPAMPPTDGNQRLLDVFSAVSSDTGYGPVQGNDPAARGAADISFAAPYIAASMDGLGPDGAGAHTLEESLRISSLKEATERAAILIYRLTREDAPEF